jgi:DNA replicative helicase MCM subunit Mcm2 (Cdc46/Mcm family)
MTEEGHEHKTEGGPTAHEEMLLEAKDFFELNIKEFGKIKKAGEKVVPIDFQEFSEHAPELGENLIDRPEETLQLLEIALEELEWTPNNARPRFTSISQNQEIHIKNIRSKHLGKMISIEGIVRMASEVRPQVTNAKFECPSCGTIISILQIDKKFKEPSRCSCGRRGGFKEISKDMVDAQALTIEEASDNLTGGEQPKRMTIFLKEDLVDPKMEMRTTPGSRIKIIGILKEIAISSSSGAMLTRFDLAVEANNVIPMEESFDEINTSEEDERAIKELAADPEIMKKMVGSIAPSIWGHESVKKALALQLFGGVKKTRSDGTHMRGDIHVLLVGDPGVAKSVMLGFISSVAPRARYVSGKSASGAGLTAAVVKDEFLKGWSLEAGAMPLANKGLLCIDEFDKMDEEDRSSMHEAMEQQTVTISKATVQATLRAQTAVLSAANPKFGRFDPTQSIHKKEIQPSTNRRSNKRNTRILRWSSKPTTNRRLTKQTNTNRCKTTRSTRKTSRSTRKNKTKKRSKTRRRKNSNRTSKRIPHGSRIRRRNRTNRRRQNSRKQQQPKKQDLRGKKHTRKTRKPTRKTHTNRRTRKRTKRKNETRRTRRSTKQTTKNRRRIQTTKRVYSENVNYKATILKKTKKRI